MRGRVGAAIVGLVLLAAGTAAGQIPDLVPVLEFGGHATPPPGQLHEGGVATVAVDRDGNVWVADSANDRVVKFDFNGRFIAAFESPRGGGAPAFRAPVDIAADKRGNIFVIDERGAGTASSRIVVLNTSGRHVRTFTVPPTAAGFEADTSGIATDARNRVYVSDPANSRIVVLSAAGTVQRQIRLTFNPMQLDVGGTDIFVSDQVGNVRHVQANGTVVSTFPMEGNVSRGVAVFGEHVYVANANRLNVDLAPYPRIRAIEAACMALPAFADAQPSRQPDAE